MTWNAGRTYDDDGHGTHVAGIIAATASPQGKYGVAFCPLVAVLDKTAAFYSWLSPHPVGGGEQNLQIQIINLSLGAPAESDTEGPKPGGEEARRGLVVCGRREPGSERTTLPRESTFGDHRGQHRPADHPPPDDVMTDHSGRGPTVDELLKPDLVALGAKITSPARRGLCGPYGNLNATPCAGAAAPILRNTRNSGWTR